MGSLKVMRLAGQLAAGMVLVAGLAGGGCVFDARYVEEVRSAPVEGRAVEAITGLDIHTRNGSVAVSRADGDEILITATLRARTRERLEKMKVVAEESESGVLVIRPEPADGRWLNNEGCSLEVSAPAAATASGLKVKTGNGRITVSGVSGRADLDTSNGRITVTEAAGEVIADTSNGRIELTDVPGPVTADTSNGAVIVRLTPDGHGPVLIDTSNGSVTLEVGRDFAGTLRARTSNGRVDIPDRFERGDRRRNAADLAMGDGPPSIISTSNGSIRVRVLEID